MSILRVIKLTVASITFIISCGFIFYFNNKVLNDWQEEHHQHSNGNGLIKKNKQLGDDCHHIFLDVGANIGVHTRFLFEPERYPLATMAQSVFSKEFGTDRDNRNICAFGFEPNPSQESRHKNMTNAYSKLGWCYHYIKAAVSDKMGNMTFYHNGDTAMEEWGFGDHDLMAGAGIPVTVPTLRLSTWLQDEILGRKLPDSVYGSYSPPKVVMKLDIESQEFAVLPDLMFTGVLCKTVDFAFGEFHYWKIDYDADEKTGRGGLHIPRGQEGVKLLRGALELFHSVKDCKTSFTELDDETYLHDGVPLPSLERAI